MKLICKKFFILLLAFLFFVEASSPILAEYNREKEITIKKLSIAIPEEDREQDTGDSIRQLLAEGNLSLEVTVIYSDKHTEMISASDCKFVPDTISQGKNSIAVSYKDKDGNRGSTNITITGIGEVKERFQQNKTNGKWYMQASDGSFYMDTFKEVDGLYYLFDRNGYLLNGWQEYYGKFYYFDENNFARKSGWFTENSLQYYLNPKDNDAMSVGWTQIDNTWYYFKENGSFGSGWICDKDKWYYIKPNGTMQTGWIEINHIWYYLTPISGVMATGWRNIDGYWYYFAANGAMVVNTVIDGYVINSEGIWAEE